MGFEFRLKTGFFETNAFDLKIGKGELIFLPKKTENHAITVFEKDIVSITLKTLKSLEIEIQTWDKIYQGVFVKKSDYEMLLKQLKEHINKKIVCEHEGGI